MNNCQSGDPDSRIAACTTLLNANQETTKDRAVIYGSRSVGYFSKGDYDRAIQDAEQAIRLNPSEASFYYTNGLAYKKKGDFDHAIQEFDDAIRLNQSFERAYYDRGNAYIDKEEYDRAIQDFNQAVDLNPIDPNNYNNRGVAYMRKGDTSGSVQDFNRAIHLNPSDTAAYVNRGLTYFLESNMPAAIADFKHTITVAPSSNAAVSAALLLHVVMKGEGRDNASQLAQVAAVADLSKWPGPVLKLEMGLTTVHKVMSAAASGIPAGQRWQVCEADYYIAEDALLHSRSAVALAHFRAARDGCPKGAFGYAGAIAELKRLGISTSPPR